MKQSGFASAEYLAIIGIVGLVMVGLVALRPQKVGPRPPVDAITPIVKLLGHPAGSLPRAPRPPRTVPGRSIGPRRVRRPTPPRPGPVVVRLPEWWGQ
jgi:hypothetical protein